MTTKHTPTTFDESLDNILTQTIYNTGAKLTEIGWEKWGENLEEAKASIKQAVIDLIGEDLQPQWSNEADYGNDEVKWCTRCDFMPSEDYEKCECLIKNERNAELRALLGKEE